MFAQLRAIRALGWQAALRARKLRRLSSETIRGFYTTRVIIALFSVGFFDELTEQQTINLQAFAAKRNLDLDVLETLCDYLFSLRILGRVGEDYALDTKGKLFIGVLSGIFYHVYAYEDVFYHLEALLRQEKTYGVDVTRRSEYVGKSSGALGRLMAFTVVADWLGNNYDHVLDLGCGDATFLIDMCTSHEHLTACGLDIAPESIAQGQGRLEEEGLQDRIHLFVGDIFEIDQMADQLQGIDAVTCIYVLHEFLSVSRERTVDFLRRFRNSLPGIPLVVCEIIRHTPDELRERPGGAVDIQLLHDLSKQKLFSREDWQALFREAGFTDVKEDYLKFARTAIYKVS